MCPTGRFSYLLVALCVYGSLSTHQEKLIWITNPGPVEKLEGSCVIINCTYMFKNETQLLWFKNSVYNHSLKKFDGTIIYSNTEKQPQAPEYSKRVQFFNIIDNERKKASCTVRINDLQVYDTGNYSFRFINNDRYMSEAMVLTVNENKCKVHIKPLESNKIFKEGDTVIFHCSTSTNCSFDPEWYDPGSGRRVTSEIISVNERGEKNSVLTLNVTWNDDGRTLACHTTEREDQCLVKTITLSVEYAPKEVKVKKLTYEVKEDKHLMINCFSKAHPNATFQWFKHNKDDYNQSGNALSWEKLKPENSGVYYCQASNHHGKENSDNITINVIYPPRRVKVNVNSTSIKKGDRLELTCLVEDSNPAVPDASYRWYKDRKNITNKRTNTLIISKITRNDNGSYSCQAENAAGMTDSVPIEVSVKFVPENTYIQGHHKIMLDSRLSLSCQTEANPSSSSYSWYFKPNHARQYVKVLQAGQVYEIDNATAFDTGVYMCSSRNNIGTGANSSEFRVVVLYRPNINITYDISSLTHWYEDVPVYLSCSVDCEPPATFYAWYRLEDNTTILSTDQNYTVQPQNPGTYYCYARNDVGNSTSDPVKLYANRLIPRWLISVLTSVFVICFLIAVGYLLYRKIHRTWRGRESFFLSIMPTPSSTGSVSTLLASCNNMRENMVMEGTTELSNFNHPAPIAHSSATDIHAGSPWQVSTVYDVIKQKDQSEEDLYKTPTNYVNLKFTEKNETTKSASSMADSHSVYAVISKQKQKGHDEDYENISGVCPPKPPSPNLDWDSESSEEEEEGVNYSQVSVIVTSQHKPRKQKCSSDEEDETEYSQVKV